MDISSLDRNLVLQLALLEEASLLESKMFWLSTQTECVKNQTDRMFQDYLAPVKREQAYLNMVLESLQNIIANVANAEKIENRKISPEDWQNRDLKKTIYYLGQELKWKGERIEKKLHHFSQMFDNQVELSRKLITYLENSYEKRLEGVEKIERLSEVLFQSIEELAIYGKGVPPQKIVVRSESPIPILSETLNAPKKIKQAASIITYKEKNTVAPAVEKKRFSPLDFREKKILEYSKLASAAIGWGLGSCAAAITATALFSDTPTIIAIKVWLGGGIGGWGALGLHYLCTDKEKRAYWL